MPWERAVGAGKGFDVLSGTGVDPPRSRPSAEGAGEPRPCFPTPVLSAHHHRSTGDFRAHGTAVPAAHRAHGAASPVSRGPGAMRGHSRRYGATSLRACRSGARWPVAPPGPLGRPVCARCPRFWARPGGSGRGSLPRVAAPRSKMAADRDTPGHVGRARAAPPPPPPGAPGRPPPPPPRQPRAPPVPPSAGTRPGASRCFLKGQAPPAHPGPPRPPRAAENKEAPETAAAGRGPARREAGGREGGEGRRRAGGGGRPGPGVGEQRAAGGRGRGRRSGTGAAAQAIGAGTCGPGGAGAGRGRGPGPGPPTAPAPGGGGGVRRPPLLLLLFGAEHMAPERPLLKPQIRTGTGGAPRRGARAGVRSRLPVAAVPPRGAARWGAPSVRSGMCCSPRRAPPSRTPRVGFGSGLGVGLGVGVGLPKGLPVRRGQR